MLCKGEVGDELFRVIGYEAAAPDLGMRNLLAWISSRHGVDAASDE